MTDSNYVTNEQLDHSIDNVKNLVTQQGIQMDGKFDTMNERFNTVDEKLKTVDERFGRVDSRLDKIDSRLDKIDSTMRGQTEMIHQVEVKTSARFEKQQYFLIGAILVPILIRVFFP
ncbi:hypothetical protein [Lentilactobacillus otakiensis]|uniref:hypothetical protein n=1 Tax=Lentilactobacillus otakiensis TaxID=481720 RepID=UPI003D177129